MIKYIARRLLNVIILVVVVVVLNFLLLHWAPGNPVQTIAGSAGGMSEQLKHALMQQYGLDKPLIVQLGIYLKDTFTGNFGQSYFFNEPVATLILQRLPATIILVLSSLFFAVILGTAMGVYASRKPNGVLSQSVTILSIVGFAAPIFWTGIMAIILLASVFPIFPVGGMRNLATLGAGPFRAAVDVAYHLVLPAVTLGIVYLAQYSRLSRASMLEVLGSDYIRTARAKGVPEWRVFYKHALRNAVLPVVTAVGMHFANILAGAILTETVFNWPGLGQLAFQAILRRDYPTILTLLFFSAVVVAIVNQLTDFAYRMIDPRIRAQ